MELFSETMLFTPAQINDWKTERMPEGEHVPLYGHQKLDEHLERLEQEFYGAPRLCCELAKLIVWIRRDIQRDEALGAFGYILENELDFLCEHLSSRWLIAVADTLADYGSAEERIGAMIPVVMLNMAKLAETERMLVSDPQVNEEMRARLQSFPPVPLWDGTSTYLLDQGDMPRNMFARIRSVLTRAPVSLQIFETLLCRLRENDNILSRIGHYNPRFWE
jgi:hypothetical protein